MGGAQEAAEAYLGRPIEGDVVVQLPGRLEWRAADELWDGAAHPGSRRLAPRTHSDG